MTRDLSACLATSRPAPAATLAVALWVGLVAAVPAPASAQGSFSPPAGCTGALTIQNRGCLMTHVWTCEGDPEGHKWVALFTEEGPFQVKQVDAEFQWLTTFYVNPVRREDMVVPAEDPESLSELFATGHDTYDFTVIPDRGGMPAQRFVGFDRITGETVIDGEPLRTTEYGYDVLTPDGAVAYRREGRQFVSERHRIFVLGESWYADAPEDIRDLSPVEFVYPGEPGFFAARPKYGCGMMMSSFEVRP